MVEDFTLASTEDYLQAYGDPLPENLEAQLARASRIVRDELAADGYNIREMINLGKVGADTAADVVVDMVAYAFRTSQVGGFTQLPGASQASMTAGPFAASATFSTPLGSLSFTRKHRKRLGVVGPKAYEVDLLSGTEPNQDPPWVSWGAE